jgi:hypothetical protein
VALHRLDERRALVPTLITLHDGRVLVMSGHGSATAGPHENTMLEIFDPSNGQ